MLSPILRPQTSRSGQEVDQDADLETTLRQIVAIDGPLYLWNGQPPATDNRDGFRPLRAAPDAARKAA
jgi:hypothetical protein